MPLPFSVAMAVNGRRSILLLKHIVKCWQDLGARIAVAGPGGYIAELGGVTLVQHETSPQRFGDAQQAALDALDGYVLLSNDNILPMAGNWQGVRMEPDAICTVRLVTILGQRYSDWATLVRGRVVNQGYHEHRPGTFINGGAQLIAPEVRRRVSYRGRVFHRSCDIGYCLDAAKAGCKLLPPMPDGPTLIKLYQFAPHPRDPERIDVPLT